MNSAVIRLCGYAGLLGACAMFVGDMLFYGQWGSAEQALSQTYEVVSRADPQHLVLGGLMSVLGGLGYVVGALHVYGRLNAQPAWLRLSLAAGFIVIAIISTATHAVWGSFALAVAGGLNTTSIANYLSLHFAIGGVIGAPVSLLLAGAIALRRTNWPRWFAVISPGGIYLLASTAYYLPAPLGAVVVGGAFNLAFALFYAVSLALKPQYRAL
jgi:hypothetical protein